MGERESFDITRELLGGSKRDFPANSLDFPVFARFYTYFPCFSLSAVVLYNALQCSAVLGTA